MNKILLTILLILSLIKPSYADGRLDGVFDLPNERRDDTCIPMFNFDRIINIVATVGIYYWFSNDFRMIHPEGEWYTVVTVAPAMDPSKAFNFSSMPDMSSLASAPPPRHSCEDRIPVDASGKAIGGIKYSYKPSILGLIDHTTPLFGWLGSYKNPDGGLTTENGPVNHGLIWLRAQDVGDMLCVQWLMTLGYRTVGCKYKQHPNHVTPGTNQSACYVDSNVCSKRFIDDAKSFLPITAPIVECVKSSVRTFFMGNGGDCRTLLSNFQENMRGVVLILLTMYVVFFAFKVIQGQQIDKGQIMLFIVKMMLVIYFSVGFNGPNGRKEGVTEFYNYAIIAANDLSQIAVMAGNDQGLCQYNSSDYRDGAKHLMAWDYLDCRMAHYMGINNIAGTGMNIFSTIMSIFALIFSPLVLIFSLLVFMFCIFFVGIIIYAVQTFLVSVILITILAFLAPIFVPMALFETTKQIFDGWLSAVIGNTLRPMIIMTFVAFMFSIMDGIMFPNCKWVVDTGNTASMSNFMTKLFGLPDGSRTWKMWRLEVDTSKTVTEQNECKNSFGRMIQCIGAARYGDCPPDVAKGAQTAWNSILQCVLFVFLFSFFVKMVDGLASDIVGSPGMSGPMGATDMFEKVKGATSSLAGKGAGAVKDAAKAKIDKLKGNRAGSNPPKPKNDSGK